MFGRISAREWNDHLRFLATRYPIKVLAQETSEPAHAWKVTPHYSPQDRAWAAEILPGSVNCRIAVAPMRFSQAPAAYQTWFATRNPEAAADPARRVQVPLDFRPRIRLVWREIGGDAAPLSAETTAGAGISRSFETIPVFFRNRGVRPPGQETVAPAGTRRLFACDLVLRQPRAYLTNEIGVFPGGILGRSVISVNPKPTVPPDINDPPRVVAMPRFVVPAVQNSFSDVFFQRFLDEPTDELHLSTVYALSPPLQEGGSFPDHVDPSFQLMTRYYCHYNLAHATRIVPRLVTPPITLVTGLAAGLGDVLYNFILSFQNDFTHAVMDLFQQRSLRGSFWVV